MATKKKKKPAKRKAVAKPKTTKGKRSSLKLKKKKKNPATIPKKDIEAWAIFVMWEAIHRANKTGFLAEQLREFTKTRTGKNPTKQHFEQYSKEVDRWLQKLEPEI